MILDYIPEAVIAVNSDLKIKWANKNAKSLFIISGNSSLLEATRLVDLENAVKKVIVNNTPAEFNIRMFRNRKQYFLNASVLLTEPDEIIIILNDLTKMHRLEQVRKDFAANVSHELRTPIQLIKGFSETILEHDLDEDQFNHGIQIIHKNAVIMENLTNDLLTLVSLEDDENPALEMIETNINELIQEAVQSVAPQADKKQIRIKTVCAPELTAKVHGSFITQAMINLLDNAVKYSKIESKIRIKATIEKTVLPDQNDILVLQVYDDGIGIPVEHQERIFERFFRVDKARSREAGGTGLGLAIVRHIAILHGGSVEVESHAGEGSCFTIKIPQK